MSKPRAISHFDRGSLIIFWMRNFSFRWRVSYSESRNFSFRWRVSYSESWNFLFRMEGFYFWMRNFSFRWRVSISEFLISAKGLIYSEWGNFSFRWRQRCQPQISEILIYQSQKAYFETKGSFSWSNTQKRLTHNIAKTCKRKNFDWILHLGSLIQRTTAVWNSVTIILLGLFTKMLIFHTKW